MKTRRGLALLGFLALLAACSDGDPRPRPDPTGSDATAAAVTTTTIRPCPAIAPPPVVVTRFHDPAGACLSPRQAMVYRCSTTAAVPVAVVDGRRYLGGTHAVAVTPNPAATIVGRAPDGTVLRADPADPGGVLVSTLIGADRWPAVPLQVTPAGVPVEGSARPAVFVVGDSVILGAEAELRAAFADWGFTIDAVESRSTGAGLEVLRARRAEVADIVVVALGYNDGADAAAWGSVVTQVLDELAAVPLVVWLTLREVRSYYIDDNAVLAQLARARPNVLIADWWRTSAPIPSTEFAADGLHLRPVAAHAMATLVNDVVRWWYHRHPNQADQSCRQTIEAAIATSP